ncbi:MAG: aminotransferase class I/II-fold pyridoxal phosphate-dependent enzyme, partial [Gammaproteobacteria bacterium]|nr:aminotransferase class I/II-fold pyridoxal phosphate-dependent enzyme [Gammaproteobacteria bacterium]
GVASETYSCVSIPVQLAALTAYTYDQRIHDFLQQQRAILSEIGNRCADMLEKSRVRVYRPEGGFYLFPDFSPFGVL